MPFSIATSPENAVTKTTRNIWTVFDDVGRLVSADVEKFREACYEGNGPLSNNVAAVPNLIIKQSLQAWDVALQEVKDNPTPSTPDPLAVIGRANLYKYIRAVQYMLTAVAALPSTVPSLAQVRDDVTDLYNSILAS